MPFISKRFGIWDVILIEPKIFYDDRGFFSEIFKSADFHAFGIIDNFVQDNYSKSQAGVLRGLHYQATPKAQGKLIQVLQGSVYDVVVDLRVGSPTFGKWESTILSDENHHILWVPPGFAHGFCVLADQVSFIYKCTNYYDATTERGICWNDHDLNISWPIANPILSEKDQVYPSLRDINKDELLRYANW
jgi:dTDP-4-dehydrorhamnose 3,5-epimerase